MPIAEPTSESGLWPRVKAITGWPRTDEDAVRALAECWRTGAERFTTAAEFDFSALPDVWPDSAGEAFAGVLGVTLDTAIVTARGMAQLAHRSTLFAEEVAGVKTGIRDLIKANLGVFGFAQSLPGGVRDLAQDFLVSQVAGMVQQIVDDAAARIAAAGGPLSAAPPPTDAGGRPGWADGLRELGAGVVDGIASFGNAALNHPELVLAGAGGVGMAVVGVGGAVGGVALSGTGVGAVGGVPLTGVSVALVGTGAVIAGGSLAAIAAEAAGDDRVTPLGGADAGAAPPKIGGPSEFAPDELRGRPADEIRGRIPDDWAERPSKSGGGQVYNDPVNRGRQIRIMPGYPPHSRPDPLTWGPYAEVSQNGKTTKVPLEGNPTLEGS